MIMNKNENVAYIEQLMSDQHEIIEMEQYADNHKVPIMDKVGISCLCQIVSIHSPKKILEVGTAIGYSAIKMAKTNNDANITSIERNEEMLEKANENIHAFQLEHRIKVLHGDALALMEQMVKQGNQFNFIFIDAAKGKYKEFFLLADKLLAEDGVIVCDNVLFRGFVANPENATSKRLQKLAKKIHDFNDWLMDLNTYQTTIIPVGDGMAISKRK